MPTIVGIGQPSNGGSLNVTIPADATHVVAVWVWASSAGGAQNLTAISLVGANAFEIQKNLASDAGATYKRAVGVAVATIASTGAGKAFSATFSGATQDGPVYGLFFLKDVKAGAASAYVRGSDAIGLPTGSAISLSVPSATTDIVLGMDSGWGSGTPATASGYTSRFTDSYINEDVRGQSANSPGASTTALTGTVTSYAAGVLISIKDVADAGNPILSSPTATVTGPTQATIGVTSDTAPTTTAISYQILPAATAAPSAATIVGAPDGTISTGSAGALTKAITGLTTNTAVKVHFAQGASSNVVSSASFTPNTLAIAGTALSAQSGTQGSAFSWSGSTPDSLISNHGNGAGSWSGSGLSGSGLSVNSSTGVLSGTCGAPAVYSATLTYTDSSTVPAAQTVSKAVTVTITALGGGGVTFAGTVPPKTGSAGSAFDFGSPALDSYFTGAGTYAAQSGSLGSIGLSIDANTGVISGATPIAGTQSVVIRKTAASGSPATADTNSFQITIEAAAVSDSGTILLPPVGDLRDGQEITIFSSLAVTALTVSGNGASVNGAPLALAANGYFRLKFNASSLAWYRIG